MSENQPFAITIDDIRQSAKRLEPVVVRTPMLESPYLNEVAGRRVLVKAEVLQWALRLLPMTEWGGNLVKR